MGSGKNSSFPNQGATAGAQDLQQGTVQSLTRILNHRKLVSCCQNENYTVSLLRQWRTEGVTRRSVQKGSTLWQDTVIDRRTPVEKIRVVENHCGKYLANRLQELDANQVDIPGLLLPFHPGLNGWHPGRDQTGGSDRRRRDRQSDNSIHREGAGASQKSP